MEPTVAQTQRQPLFVIRVPEDLREMVNAIAAFELTNQFEVAEALLREPIEARFNKLPKELRERALARIQAASAK